MLSVAGIFALGYLGILQNDWLSSFLIQIVVMFALPMLMYTLIVSKSFKKTFKDTGFKKISGRMIATAFLLGIILYLINNFVANVFSGIISFFGYESLSSTKTIQLNYSLLLKEFLLSAILPAICEEFLHRGILLFSGKKTGNTRYALIISSILFGLIHLNINQFFYAAILGYLMGYVTIISDSIYPAIIIHFCNNFLSSFFYYGYYMNWPFARFYNGIITAIYSSNIFVFVLITSFGIIGLLWLYTYLTKRMLILRAKMDVEKVIKELELNDLPIEIAQEKINQANKILQHTEENHKNESKPTTKYTYFDKIFMLSSFVLGALITISTFIWGVI